MLVPARSDAAVAARTSRALRVASTSVEAWLLAGLTGLGAVLRFATLGAQSYWFDEAQAAHELHLSFGSMVSQMILHETNPPLYFVLGWLWARVFGTGEVGLRSLSALIGTAVIPIAYLCGRELVSRRAGLVAAALAAVSPFLIWYSQEAREYMLLTALCGLSLLYFARAWRDPSGRNIALWAVFSALAVLTHFFAGFLVAPEALWLLYVIRNRTIAFAAAAVGGCPAGAGPAVGLAGRGTSLLGFITGTRLARGFSRCRSRSGSGNLYESSAVQLRAARRGRTGGGRDRAAGGRGRLEGASRRRRGRRAGGSRAAGPARSRSPRGGLLHTAGVDARLDPARRRGCRRLHDPRLRVAGAVLAAILLAGFVLRADEDQRRTRSISAPTGEAWPRRWAAPAEPRAIVAYDGGTGHRSTRDLPSARPVEPADRAVGDGRRGRRGRLPLADARASAARRRTLISTKAVNDYLVDRFSIDPAREPDQGADRHQPPARCSVPVVGAAVLVQNAASAR